jgi:hypothetical protein
MLGRAGIPTAVIDPHEIYPFDFRVEKLSGGTQLDLLVKTGIADSVLCSTTHDGENWIARSGYLLDKQPRQQFGIMYTSLIMAIRSAIPKPAELVYAGCRCFDQRGAPEAHAFKWRSDSARLVVLANGLNIAAPQSRHRTPDHQRVPLRSRVRSGAGRPQSVQISGADLFFGTAERSYPLSDAVSIGDKMRANLFAYREADIRGCARCGTSRSRP